MASTIGFVPQVALIESFLTLVRTEFWNVCRVDQVPTNLNCKNTRKIDKDQDRIPEFRMFNY